jgi:hypothetical protein
MSNWSELNKEHVRRLDRLGFMTVARKKVLPDMNFYTLCIHQPIYGYSYLRAFFVHECTDPYH